MTKHKSSTRPPTPLEHHTRYYGVQGKIVEWVDHTFEDDALFIIVRFTDKTELCWTLQAAHVITEAVLSNWKTGNLKNLRFFAENEIHWDT